MPRFAHQGGAGPIASAVTVRTLLRRIVLRSEDPEVMHALRYLECAPEIDGFPPRDLDIRIESFRGRYRIIEDGVAAREELTPQCVLHYLHQRVYVLSIEDQPQALLLHAGCLRRGDRRILLIGTEGAGKTTLTLNLMMRGYEIEGDENVFIDIPGVIARPRALRVKERALAQVPEIADRVAAAPFMTDFYGRKIYNLDPRLLGKRWQIRQGAVDFVLLLRANHGGASSIRQLGPLAAAREVMAEIAFPATGKGSAVAALSALTSRARAYDLSLGETREAVRLIDRLFGGPGG